MGRISTYALDSDITKGDIVIGSDGGGTTKNYQISEIGKAISKFNMSGLPQLGYFLQTSFPAGKLPGSMSIAGNNATVPFTNISSIVVSKFTIGETRTQLQLLLSFVGTEITITSIDNPNLFGTYTLDSATVLASDNNFFTLALFNTGGNGNMVKDQFYVISSRKGDSSFVFSQPANNPVAVWQVAHNLGKRPSVTIVTSTDTQVVGEVQYVNAAGNLSANDLRITFSGANSGKAYMN